MFSTRILASFITALLPQLAQAAEWQFGGATQIDKVAALVFFDTDSIQRPSATVARVWTKSISVRALDQYWAKHRDDVTDKAARKLVTGHGPSFFLLDPIQSMYTAKDLSDNIVTYTGYEVIANKIDTPPINKIFFEIDCEGKRVRGLGGAAYNRKGDITKNSSTENAPYGFIVPETNGEYLMLLVCPESSRR